jgi:DHA2 family lincomycin resistance protein-like MFS transporter
VKLTGGISLIAGKVDLEEKKEFRAVPMMAVLAVAAFIGLFSETALNLALINIMHDFNIEASTAQWLTTGYLLTLGILVPVSAILIQTFTTRQLFFFSLAMGIVGTLIGGLAHSFPILVSARVIQAIGTAILLPLMTNCTLVIFPPHKRGLVMGLMGLVIMSAPAFGPTFSGIIVDQLSWHWIFWICLPILLLSLGAGIFFMKNVTKLTKPKIDISSVILSSIGFGGIVYGFSAAGEGGGGWGEAHVLLPIGIGLFFLILFSLRQIYTDNPMINLRVFTYPMFSLGVLLVFLAMLMILSNAILLPMYLKGGLLLSAFTAGLMLLPGGLLNGIMSPINGKLMDKYGARWLVVIGFVLTSIASILLLQIAADTPLSTIILMHVCLSIGIAFIMMPSQTNGLNQLPRKYYPDGTAVMSTLQQIAGAIGTALAITFMTMGQTSYLNEAGSNPNPEVLTEALIYGVKKGYILIMVASITGLLLSLFLKRVKV